MELSRDSFEYWVKVAHEVLEVIGHENRETLRDLLASDRIMLERYLNPLTRKQLIAELQPVFKAHASMLKEAV